MPQPVDWSREFIFQVLLLGVLSNLLFAILRGLWAMAIKRLLRSGNERLAAWAERKFERAHVIGDALHASPIFATAYLVRELARVLFSIVALAGGLLGWTVSSLVHGEHWYDSLYRWTNTALVVAALVGLNLGVRRIKKFYGQLVDDLIQKPCAQEPGTPETSAQPAPRSTSGPSEPEPGGQQGVSR